MKFISPQAALNYILAHTNGPRHAIIAAAGYLSEQFEQIGNNNGDALVALETRVRDLEADLATANALVAKQQADLIRLTTPVGPGDTVSEAPKRGRKKAADDTAV